MKPFAVCWGCNRAAMAILRQQVSFVEQLFLSGMVAAPEREEMMEPLEERVRELYRRGAIWRPPLLLDVSAGV